MKEIELDARVTLYFNSLLAENDPSLPYEERQRAKETKESLASQFQSEIEKERKEMRKNPLTKG